MFHVKSVRIHLDYLSDTVTAGELEDYGRLMYSKVKDFNVPTWVVGKEKEIVIDGEFAEESLVLEMWAKREKTKVVNSIELNFVVERLMNSHCSKNRENKLSLKDGIFTIWQFVYKGDELWIFYNMGYCVLNLSKIIIGTLGKLVTAN